MNSITSYARYTNHKLKSYYEVSHHGDMILTRTEWIDKDTGLLNDNQNDVEILPAVVAYYTNGLVRKKIYCTDGYETAIVSYHKNGTVKYEISIDGTYNMKTRYYENGTIKSETYDKVTKNADVTEISEMLDKMNF